MPLYATGDPIEPKVVSDQQGIISLICKVTALNISGSKPKLTVAFVFLFVIYTVGAFVMLFSYWKKSIEWGDKKHSHDEKFLDQDIAQHSVIVKNLDTDLSISQMDYHIKTVFDKMFPAGSIQCIKTIGKKDDLFETAGYLRDNKKKLRYYKKQNAANEKT